MLIAEGMSVKEVALYLGTSAQAINKRIHRIYTDLGLEGERRNLITAILVAMKRGEIRPRGMGNILLV